MKRIVIIGAGLAGTLLSLYLAKRGYDITIIEARGDLRLEGGDKGRSINLALSCRGITSLDTLGLMSGVAKIMVPMRARAIHEEDGTIVYQPFGRHNDEHINAIQRSDLNAFLLDEIDKYSSIKLIFNAKVTDIHLQEQKLICENLLDETYSEKTFDILIGADGAGSVLRDALAKANIIKAKREFLRHGYKELSITRQHSPLFKEEHLHLWPRGAYSLLGNPNTDGSITGSLFLPQEGPDSFTTLTDVESVFSFFKRAFPDVYEIMPNLAEEFFSHPTGHLSTVTCDPWYYRENYLLLGDAAHGLVPFFGQGMNCAFEDCRILNELLSQYHDDWSKVMPEFYRTRKPNTDAVAKMSMDNYIEIQENIRNERFNFRKRLEREIMVRFPDVYVSKHVMVMFTNIPYENALRIGEEQHTLLDNIMEEGDEWNQINWNNIEQKVQDYAKKMTV